MHAGMLTLISGSPFFQDLPCYLAYQTYTSYQKARRPLQVSGKSGSSPGSGCCFYDCLSGFT